MNVFFRIGDTVVTPVLNGDFLEGITRDSVIRLLQHWSIPVEERLLSIDEIVEAQRNGDLKEAFGTGTAAVISPSESCTGGRRSCGSEAVKQGNYPEGSMTR
ncbi:aminotransferase class IV [Paenibacillus sp. P26]|nr:aminotransferase class IV [Paenibacillus sp. P26]